MPKPIIVYDFRSPLRRPGGYKIPTIPTAVMDLNVFSQVVEDDDSYLNVRSSIILEVFNIQILKLEL